MLPETGVCSSEVADAHGAPRDAPLVTPVRISTDAPRRTRAEAQVDEIARGLSPFQPETVSIQAGRLMLERLRELLAAGETFALETTLATRHYLRFIREARAQGYLVRLLFFWLNSPDLAIERVVSRVREGGHNIPELVVRRL